MRDEHRGNVGAAIAHLRERQGWSQRQLASWVGLDQSALSRIEAGRRRVSAEELQRFADTLHVSADALLAGHWDSEPLADGAADMALGAPSPESPAAEPASPERLASPMPSALEEDTARPPTRPRRRPTYERRLSPSRTDRRVEAPFMAQDVSPTRGVGVTADIAGPAQAHPLPGIPGSSTDESTARKVRLPARQRGSRLDELPAAIASVVRDWFELRRLAGLQDSPLAWSTGHSAEGKPARFAHPIQPAQRGLDDGDVLYDRIARFWRSELHVDPDDGPVPDLVPLLEDALGVQVVVARVAGGSAWDHQARRAARERAESLTQPGSGEHPVGGVVTVHGVPFLFVNAARPVVLQRFTLAHALAHLVLGHGDVIDDRIVWSRNNPREAAANDFAEEFLLPVRAARRWYERRGEPRPDVATLLELGNAFGISVWSAFYRSRAAGRLSGRRFALLRQELHRLEWELLPRQAFLGGLRDTLSQLTPGESLPPGRYGSPAVLRVPAAMRRWAVDALRGGRLDATSAAALLHVEPDDLRRQLDAFGVPPE